jgi:hypothetical protein
MTRNEALGAFKSLVKLTRNEIADQKIPTQVGIKPSAQDRLDGRELIRLRLRVRKLERKLEARGLHVSYGGKKLMETYEQKNRVREEFIRHRNGKLAQLENLRVNGQVELLLASNKTSTNTLRKLTAQVKALLK